MRSAFATAASLALLAGHSADAADSASSLFPRAVHGDGFVAVPVNAVSRPAGSHRKVSDRAQNAFEDTLKNFKFFYATDLSIGSPPQTVTVLVDTGSSELWVSPDCTTAPSEAQMQQCQSFGFYLPSNSKSHTGPFGSSKLDYGDASDDSTHTSVDIEYYTDTISLGGSQITNQTFGVVTESQGQSQGIMGLAPDLSAGYQPNKPYSLLLNTFASQGVIKSRVFSLDLRHSTDKQGAVVYGGIDRSKFIGNLEKLPIAKGIHGEYRLAVELSSVGVTLNNGPQSFNVAGADANVMLDSGTSISRMHNSVAEPILEVLQAVTDGEGYYYTDCSNRNVAGSVDFGFGNKTVRVPLSDFIMDIGDPNYCYVGFVITTDQQVLGDSVLRAGYFVFDWDNQNVHIAQAANCGDNDIVAVGSGPNAVPSIQGNCKDSDAFPTVAPSVTAKPTKTRTRTKAPTGTYTTVYTVTSCPPIDPDCETGRVTTQTITPAPALPTSKPTATSGGGSGSGGKDGGKGGDSKGSGDKDSAGMHLMAWPWAVGMAAAVAAAPNAL